MISCVSASWEEDGDAGGFCPKWNGREFISHKTKEGVLLNKVFLRITAAVYVSLLVSQRPTKKLHTRPNIFLGFWNKYILPKLQTGVSVAPRMNYCLQKATVFTNSLPYRVAGFRQCQRRCFCPSGHAGSTGHVTCHPHLHRELHLAWSGRWCPWVWRPPLGWTRRPRWDPPPGHSGTVRLWRYKHCTDYCTTEAILLHKGRGWLVKRFFEDFGNSLVTICRWHNRTKKSITKQNHSKFRELQS